MSRIIAAVFGTIADGLYLAGAWCNAIAVKAIMHKYAEGHPSNGN